MAIEKKRLSVEEIEAQTALELPDRETLATVVIGCLALCVGQIQIRNVDVNVAAQVCAAVQALNVALLGLTLTARITRAPRSRSTYARRSSGRVSSIRSPKCSRSFTRRWSLFLSCSP